MHASERVEQPHVDARVKMNLCTILATTSGTHSNNHVCRNEWDFHMEICVWIKTRFMQSIMQIVMLNYCYLNHLIWFFFNSAILFKKKNVLKIYSLKNTNFQLTKIKSWSKFKLWEFGHRFFSHAAKTRRVGHEGLSSPRASISWFLKITASLKRANPFARPRKETCALLVRFYEKSAYACVYLFSPLAISFDQANWRWCLLIADPAKLGKGRQNRRWDLRRASPELQQAADSNLSPPEGIQQLHPLHQRWG